MRTRCGLSQRSVPENIGCNFRSHQTGALCLWGGQRLWALGGPGHPAELPSCHQLHLRSRVLRNWVQLIAWSMHSHTCGYCIPWSYITTQGSHGSCGWRGSQSWLLPSRSPLSYRCHSVKYNKVSNMHQPMALCLSEKGLVGSLWEHLVQHHHHSYRCHMIPPEHGEILGADTQVTSTSASREAGGCNSPGLQFTRWLPKVPSQFKTQHYVRSSSWPNAVRLIPK